MIIPTLKLNRVQNNNNDTQFIIFSDRANC